MILYTTKKLTFVVFKNALLQRKNQSVERNPNRIRKPVLTGINL